MFFRPSHIAPTQEARVLPTINLSCLQTAGAPRRRPSRVTPRTAPVNFHAAGTGGRRRPRSGGASVDCERGKKNTEFISLLYEGDTHLFFELRVALHRQYGDMVSPTRACGGGRGWTRSEVYARAGCTLPAITRKRAYAGTAQRNVYP